MTAGWQAVSGYTKDESFTVIRYDGISKGNVRRMHALIEDLLSEHLGEGGRVE